MGELYVNSVHKKEIYSFFHEQLYEWIQESIFYGWAIINNYIP